MGYGKDVREELRVPSRELRHAIPLTAAGMAAGERAGSARAWRRPE